MAQTITLIILQIRQIPPNTDLGIGPLQHIEFAVAQNGTILRYNVDISMGLA